jgi:hypothetical protein
VLEGKAHDSLMGSFSFHGLRVMCAQTHTKAFNLLHLELFNVASTGRASLIGIIQCLARPRYAR